MCSCASEESEIKLVDSKQEKGSVLWTQFSCLLWSRLPTKKKKNTEVLKVARK